MNYKEIEEANEIISYETETNLTAHGVRNLILYKIVKELKETNRLLMVLAKNTEKRDTTGLGPYDDKVVIGE